MKYPVIFKCLGHGIERWLEICENGPVGVRFSKNVIPLARTSSSIIVTDKPVSLGYRIKISGNSPLTIESGVHIADLYTVKDGSYTYTPVYNRPIVPDFTTPYLVFGLCGGTIVCIVSAFSKVLLDIL
ncbi:uncharacterized protein NEMAJ01_2114 [Nematocida major]|uniref:uncharacterized protein n=1 Tax=Nematocida major TaxID=1912982 RepID=UPI0020072E47|nr:uncharacterized protein NEMAJ01_2114 [Nematocida major]KAH9387218.1 hypothetical protein NEMAJ01_2114 [Nematocida major]